MNTLKRSDEFHTWLTGLKDGQGRARILRRLANTQAGNFGDCEPVGDGVSEMRIHTGPGYRVYFVRRGETLYLLLCGGDKSTRNATSTALGKWPGRSRRHDPWNSATSMYRTT